MKTQNTALKIGLACALGALIGTMVSLKINNHFWWVGTLVGFAAGYLSYEFPKLIKAIPDAWSKTATNFHNIDWPKISLKIAKDERKIFWLTISMFIIVGVINLLISLFSINHLVTEDVQKMSPSILLLATYLYLLVVCSGGLTFLLGFIIPFRFFLRSSKIELADNIAAYGDNEDDLKMMKKIIKFGNPIVLPLFCTYFTFKFVLGFIWDTLKFICKFFKNLFLLVHSEARLICGVDAGLGSIIGYFFESPILGVLFGAVFGILNYYVVSIKILKMQPKF